jgi:GMP synthase-like glutamine amidotransferase
MCVEWNHKEEIKREHRDDMKSKDQFPDFDAIFKNYASTQICEIQAIKHLQRPIFGIQFHPETKSTSKIDGIGPALEHGMLLLHGFFDIVLHQASIS